MLDHEAASICEDRRTSESPGGRPKNEARNSRN